ncbi:uncharacterized protein MELLADRAFT_123581 [Melampsora larici-populina 98AG31]|uniref:Secreted protein n=1 Tax=Melampsora larici-populina (strain 98AG31 / pathotype 3-4-7) TaxID=747676 RepID=F4RDW9_MELLP|nr:uncharacterized protein MELLADRAFT_123581 [Melampsora larici-populina 98AG31]EGG09537.1 secreted protein [Melampsora larici-populina 98AG31]
MTLQTLLKLALMCITLTVFMEMCSAKSKTIACKTDYNINHNVAVCGETSDGAHQHDCNPASCKSNGALYVQRAGCVVDPDGKEASTEHCHQYNYADDKHFYCESPRGNFKCPWKIGDGPVISCSDCHN